MASPCNDRLDSPCMDPTLALQLRVISIGVILITGTFGVALPWIGRGLRVISTEGDGFFVARAFAAGVILATGFVHILPDGVEALGKPCLPEFWSSFPFAGFVAMLSALTSLVLDNLYTQYFQDLQSHPTPSEKSVSSAAPGSEYEPLIRSASMYETTGRNLDMHKPSSRPGSYPNVFVSSNFGTSHHRHNTVVTDELSERTEDEEAHIRNIVISQILEVAVIAHSFIIGVSLGVSENPCAIRPLVAALSFHQFFEGFALGGCICQAGFGFTSTTIRAGLFAVTTPVGILVGIAISSSYNPNTPQASIVEGLFDSASAGILIYMALVGLIATDSRSERLRGNRRLQFLWFLSVFGGTLSMSSLAFWA